MTTHRDVRDDGGVELVRSGRPVDGLHDSLPDPLDELGLGHRLLGLLRLDVLDDLL